MLVRPPIIDDLKTILSDWVAGLTNPKPLAAYLFGSTINEDGIRFDPATGDLDVLLLVDWERLSPIDRVEQLKSLREAKQELESKLFLALHREKGSDQIVSLVPLTPFEIEQAVHKHNIQHIMTGALVYDLIAKKIVCNLSGGQAAKPLTSVHRPAMDFVQAKRAEAVSMAPNGKGGLEPKPHDDPVPKELARHFAAAAFDPATETDPSDLARGLREVNKFAVGAADWGPMSSQFASWLEVKRGTRGEVPQNISADHYLLLTEAIFDRVRAQYPSDATVRYGGSAINPVTPANVPPVLPSQTRLTASFSVTLADKLGGTKSDHLRAVRAARANMKAGLPDAFELKFDEAVDAAELLAAADDTLSDAEHQIKVKAHERRTLVAARQIRWQSGIWLILYYGGTLFHCDENIMEEACVSAISNWIAIAAMNDANPGGVFEATHREFYPSHRMSVRFPGAGSIQDALVGGLPVDALTPDQLAIGFVPNLVSKYLYLISQDPRGFLNTHERRVFNVTEWQYGVI